MGRSMPMLRIESSNEPQSWTSGKGEAVSDKQTFEGWRTGGVCDERLGKGSSSIDIKVAAVAQFRFTGKRWIGGWDQ